MIFLGLSRWMLRICLVVFLLTVLHWTAYATVDGKIDRISSTGEVIGYSQDVSSPWATRNIKICVNSAIQNMNCTAVVSCAANQSDMNSVLPAGHVFKCQLPSKYFNNKNYFVQAFDGSTQLNNSPYFFSGLVVASTSQITKVSDANGEVQVASSGQIPAAILTGVNAEDSVQFYAYYRGEAGEMTITRNFNYQGNSVISSVKLPSEGLESWGELRHVLGEETFDSHNTIAMAVDTTGYLHVAGDMHSHPMFYFRSTGPCNNNQSFAMERIKPMVSIENDDELVSEREDVVTYPTFFKDASGKLYFSYRIGSHVRGDWYYNQYDTVAKKWTSLISNNKPLLKGKITGNNPYHNSPLLGPDGNYHVAMVWRGGENIQGTHSLSYMRSRDLKNWQAVNKGGVSNLTIPIEYNPSSALNNFIVDPIPPYAGLTNLNYSMTFTSKQRPVIAYHAYSDSRATSEVRIALLQPSNVWLIKKISLTGFKWDLVTPGHLGDLQVSPIKLVDRYLYLEISIINLPKRKVYLRQDDLVEVNEIFLPQPALSSTTGSTLPSVTVGSQVRAVATPFPLSYAADSSFTPSSIRQMNAYYWNDQAGPGNGDFSYQLISYGNTNSPWYSGVYAKSSGSGYEQVITNPTPLYLRSETRTAPIIPKPADPILKYPMNVTVLPTNVLLQWRYEETSSLCGQFFIHYCKETIINGITKCDFALNMRSAASNVRSFQMPTPLDSNSTYQWRVRCANGPMWVNGKFFTANPVSNGAVLISMGPDPDPNVIITSGAQISFLISVKNTGTSTWNNANTFLSPVSETAATWSVAPIGLPVTSIAPGGTANFRFMAKAPKLPPAAGSGGTLSAPMVWQIKHSDNGFGNFQKNFTVKSSVKLNNLTQNFSALRSFDLIRIKTWSDGQDSSMVVTLRDAQEVIIAKQKFSKIIHEGFIELNSFVGAPAGNYTVEISETQKCGPLGTFKAPDRSIITMNGTQSPSNSVLNMLISKDGLASKPELVKTYVQLYTTVDGKRVEDTSYQQNVKFISSRSVDSIRRIQNFAVPTTFNRLLVHVKNFISSDRGTLTLKLYKTPLLPNSTNKLNYDLAAVLSTPVIAEKKFYNIRSGVSLEMNFPLQASGHYYWFLSDPEGGLCGVYAHDNTKLPPGTTQYGGSAYENDKPTANFDYRSKIIYFADPTLDD